MKRRASVSKMDRVSNWMRFCREERQGNIYYLRSRDIISGVGIHSGDGMEIPEVLGRYTVICLSLFCGQIHIRLKRVVLELMREK